MQLMSSCFLECVLRRSELRDESMEGTRLLDCSREHSGGRVPNGVRRPAEEGLGGRGGRAEGDRGPSVTGHDAQGRQ